jgi:hypothetical protein
LRRLPRRAQTQARPNTWPVRLSADGIKVLRAAEPEITGGSDSSVRILVPFVATQVTAEVTDRLPQLGLIATRSTGTDHYWSTRALQVLTDDLTPQVVPLLATLGWPLRSLAAIVWAKSDNLDSSLGVSLSKDPGQRVRRALAGALATVPADPRTDPARQHLAGDPRFSVRSALHKEERNSVPGHCRPDETTE